MQLKESVAIRRKYKVLFQEISLIENKGEDMVYRAHTCQHRGHTLEGTHLLERRKLKGTFHC